MLITTKIENIKIINSIYTNKNENIEKYKRLLRVLFFLLKSLQSINKRRMLNKFYALLIALTTIFD